MVNIRLSLFSPYFRNFENHVLGYAISSYFSAIIWPKSRYLRRSKFYFWWSEKAFENTRKEAEKEAESKSEAKEESQCEAEEAGCEAQEAIEEENGYEKEISRLKTRKEVSMVYSESTLVGCYVR